MINKLVRKGAGPRAPRGFRGVLIHYETRCRLWDLGYSGVVIRVHDELRVAVQARVGISIRSPMCRWMQGIQGGPR